MSTESQPQAGGLIQRRHVFYVEGYDPQGAAGYNRLFLREFKRCQKVWPITANVGELSIDSEELAHWTVEAAGPNWRVSTRYEFLRLEAVISGYLAQPTLRQLWRAICWMFDDLASGALFRIFRASWRFALHLVYPQVMLILWVALSAACGVAAARIVDFLLGLPTLVPIAVGVATAIAVFMALIPLAERLFVIRITNGWPYMREFARGAPSAYDRPVEVYAQRIVAAARAAEADEILVVGHSAGGMTSVAVMARALQIDPDLGRHGPRVVYLTVGSLLPAFALHPAASRIREAIARIAEQPAVLWIDGQSRKDVMNFWNIDPVESANLDIAKPRNPLIWPVRMGDLLSADFYKRIRTNYFRIHYQWIMANDRRAPYDYFMLVCGPAPVEQWARRPHETLVAFAEDASYVRLRQR